MNKAERKEIRQRIARIQSRIVDTAGKIVDAVIADLDNTTPPRTAPAHSAPAHVARRQIANMMRASQFCANRACRRSHCCRGEPLHCLQAVVPLLPADAFHGLLRKSRHNSGAKNAPKRGAAAPARSSSARSA